MIGHVVPVPSTTGPGDGDLEDQYVSARFRVMMSEPDYRRVVAHIRDRQKNSTLWHAALYNCNAWVGDIARFMGLKAPTNTWQFPAEYINEMARLNTQQDVAAANLGEQAPPPQ